MSKKNLNKAKTTTKTSKKLNKAKTVAETSKKPEPTKKDPITQINKRTIDTIAENQTLAITTAKTEPEDLEAMATSTIKADKEKLEDTTEEQKSSDDKSETKETMTILKTSKKKTQEIKPIGHKINNPVLEPVFIITK